MPIQDRDWHDGMEHEYHQEPESPEPPETNPETDIVMVVSAKKKTRGGYLDQDRIDLCLYCATLMLKKAMGIDDGD
jgi:hypothetical protein